MQLTEEKQKVLPEIFFWSRSGPVFLLGIFAVLLFKYAPFYWPMIVVALAGYAATRFLGKKGIVFSLVALAIATTQMVLSGEEIFWMILLPTSIVLSWSLILCKDKEQAALEDARQEHLLSSEKSHRALQEQLRAAKFALAEETQKNDTEKERLNVLNDKTFSALNTAKLTLTVAEQEKEKSAQLNRILNAKCESLAQEIVVQQQKESNLKQALASAQSELFTLKNHLSTLQTQEFQERESEDKELKYKYATLREQFDEKSATLDEARKELFKVENELLALQKAYEEKNLESSDEEETLIRELKMMEEERCSLEDAMMQLQEFISLLLSLKKRVTTPRKPRKKKSTDLPNMIQSIIDLKMPVE